MTDCIFCCAMCKDSPCRVNVGNYSNAPSKCPYDGTPAEFFIEEVRE